MKKSIPWLTSALGLLLVSPASAHVEARPAKAPADSVRRIVLLVEGEESVPSIKVTVQMPRGLTDVTFHPAPGWKRSQSGRVVTWSGGEIELEKFGRFPFTAHLPATPGRVLTFPTIETYADGKVVRWIGAESSDTPAARMTLSASKTAPQPPPPPPASTQATAPASSDDDRSVAFWLVGVGVVVAAGVVGLVLWRRRR